MVTGEWKLCRVTVQYSDRIYDICFGYLQDILKISGGFEILTKTMVHVLLYPEIHLQTKTWNVSGVE